MKNNKPFFNYDLQIINYDFYFKSNNYENGTVRENIDNKGSFYLLAFFPVVASSSNLSTNI
jgi:hypothetical protein